MNRDIISRVLPFAAFMLFIGAQEALDYLGNPYPEAAPYIIYPLKALATGALLIFFRRSYHEVRLKDLSKASDTLLSIISGIVVFVLWVNMDWAFATIGEPAGFNPMLIEDNALRALSTGIRLFSASLIVPVMEEIFWRSFLIRYIDKPDFMSVQVGSFAWASFLISSVLFGLEHNLFLAGIMAGVAYNLLLYKTKSIAQCILAHATTNFALGIYVLTTGNWQFW